MKARAALFAVFVAATLGGCATYKIYPTAVPIPSAPPSSAIPAKPQAYCTAPGVWVYDPPSMAYVCVVRTPVHPYYSPPYPPYVPYMGPRGSYLRWEYRSW